MTRPPEPRRIPAPVLALAAAALFGASTPLAAPLVRSTSPVLIAGLLYPGSALGLGIWWLIARPRLGLRPLPRAERAAFMGAILFGGVLGPALLIGAVGYGASLVLFIFALRELGSARTAAYFASAPFAGVALALVIGAEAPPLSFLLAAALMATGVWLHLSERHAHAHTHEAQLHDHEHVHEPGQNPSEPHRHLHRHQPLTHTHLHTPDLHHRHH